MIEYLYQRKLWKRSRYNKQYRSALGYHCNMSIFGTLWWTLEPEGSTGERLTWRFLEERKVWNREYRRSRDHAKH